MLSYRKVRAEGYGEVQEHSHIADILQFPALKISWKECSERDLPIWVEPGTVK